MGILESIRAAVAGPASDAAQADEPGANTSIVTTEEEEGSMPNADSAPGAANNAGISEADHNAAIAAAEASGQAAGAKVAEDRLATVLGADGIKGDGKRMGAALDLALKSPGMSADDVVNFITGNVGGNAMASDSYEQQRLASAALSQPPGGTPQKSGLSAAVDRQIESMKR